MTHIHGDASPSKKTDVGNVRESMLLLISTVIFQFSRFTVSVLAARWLGPTEFGTWNILNSFLAYSVIFLLGVPNGMSSLVPLFNSKEKFTNSASLITTALWFCLFANVVLSGLFLLLSISLKIFNDTMYAFAFLLISWNMYQFFQSVLSAQIKFKTVVVQRIFFAIILTILALPMTYYYSTTGFILAQSFTSLLATIYIMYMLRFNLSLRFVRNDLRILLRSGFPIMLIGILYTVLTSIDRWVILALLGADALGDYTISILVFSISSLVSSTIGQQVYPRMIYTFGRHSRLNELTPLMRYHISMNISLLLPLIFLAQLLLPFLIETILPKYGNGVQAAQITLLGVIPLSIAEAFAGFLHATRKQSHYLAVQIFSISLGIVVLVALTIYYNNIVGVAIGTLIVNSIYAAALAIVSINTIYLGGNNACE